MSLSDKILIAECDKGVFRALVDNDVREAVRELKERIKSNLNIYIETEEELIKDIDEIFGEKLI